MNLSSLLNDFSQINAYAKLDPAGNRQLRIPGLQIALHLDRALHSLHYAGELSQQAIPPGARYSAAALPEIST